MITHKFDIKLYYPEGFDISEYGVLGDFYMDFYLNDEGSNTSKGIHISYHAFTAGMGDKTVDDIINEFQKDKDVEQIIYQEGNKAFVCEGDGIILVGTLEQGTYFMEMRISFESEYTDFCRAFAKKIYTQFKNNVVFASPKPLVAPERDDEFIGDLVIEKGNIIQFGYYEQDNILENGFEPIEWEVLEVQGDKALIISKYILDYELFKDTGDRKKVTWEKSDLRIWLNDYFYNLAFCEAEKKIILETDVSNESEFLVLISDNATRDKIFTLSIDEWLLYFSERREIPLATKYAEHDACDKAGYYSYWMRTPGEWANYGTLCVANSEGWWGERDAATDTGVRPVMWIEVAKNITNTPTPTVTSKVTQCFILNKDYNEEPIILKRPRKKKLYGMVEL